MACPCRALRAFVLARASFARPTLLAGPYRAYSTGPSDPAPDQSPKPTEDPAASDARPKSHSRSTENPNPPSSEQTSDASTAGKPAKQRRRRTIGPKKPTPPQKQPWQAQKDALKRKFPFGWAPPKRLSPDALAGLRALHAQFPDTYTTPVLSDLFGISPEAVRRILKSKWAPATPEEEEKRRERWIRRGERIWERWAGLGFKVPSKWRPEGVSKWGGRVQRTTGEEGQEEDAEEGGKTDTKGGVSGVRARRRVTGRIM
ncbi:hypothetical protein VUR80DRAFT_3470 [Thermomyces stellatus]